MSFFTSLGIIILSMLIMVFLQLSPGIFAIFYHHALGKYSKSKVSSLSLFYIIGAETAAAALFFSSCLFANLIFYCDNHPEKNLFAWIAVGILGVLAFASLFYYYRRGSGTRLFIPRKIAHAFTAHAACVKTRSDAFILGAASNIPELVFTFPLYLITAIDVIEIGTRYHSSDILSVLYILTPTFMLFITRYLFKTGHNLADIQRLRVHDKNFTRLILFLSYITIAIIIICFRIIT